MKKVFLVLIFCGLTSLFGCQSVQVEKKLEEPAVKIEEGTQEVNIGNKFCPVSGEEIDEQTRAAYEYNGVIYNFCSPECIEEFKKDPEKYIKKVEAELKAQAEEKERQRQKEIEKQSEPMQAPHQEHL